MDVRYQRSFLKRLNKLPEKIQAKFATRLDLFVENQTHRTLNNHGVENAYPNCRSINITGDYRAIFRVEGETAVFYLIGTHAELC